ncbi:MAG: hypothetical protein M3Y69_02120 [Verrucomicrobiota bacterium]|nr:hypothetical protein [Verrucomicrobiota bacterium]
MTNRSRVTALLSLGLASWIGSGHAAAQEGVAEEVRVEATFVASPFELQRDHAVEILAERLTLHTAALHSAELQRANENSVTRLLELTKYIPIPLGSSENRVDTFFQSNYMRVDLNPRGENPLFGNK